MSAPRQHYRRDRPNLLKLRHLSKFPIAARQIYCSAKARSSLQPTTRTTDVSHQYRDQAVQKLRPSSRANSSKSQKPTSRAKWAVFFFYPADFTFVCPTELGDLADHHAELQRLGVEVFSVSTDTHFTHKAWHDSSETIGKIKYAMIGDPTGAITRNFEVMREGEGLADRGTFVVDPNGVIQAMEVTAEGIAATPPIFSARSRPLSTSPRIRVKSALRSGKKARRRSLPRCSSSARSRTRDGLPAIRGGHLCIP